jgi:hypothetical protein
VPQLESSGQRCSIPGYRRDQEIAEPIRYVFVGERDHEWKANQELAASFAAKGGATPITSGNLFCPIRTRINSA